MRHRHGTVEVIRLCVESSAPKSGFRKAVELGIKEWSLEAAVVKRRAQFTEKTPAYAHARLNGQLDE
jgi:hypothetical protein